MADMTPPLICCFILDIHFVLVSKEPFGPCINRWKQNWLSTKENKMNILFIYQNSFIRNIISRNCHFEAVSLICLIKLLIWTLRIFRCCLTVTIENMLNRKYLSILTGFMFRSWWMCSRNFCSFQRLNSQEHLIMTIFLELLVFSTQS